MSQYKEMDRSKKNQGPGIVLIIDPGVQCAEVEAYNLLAGILDDVRAFNGMGHLSFRYWLPTLGDHNTVASFTRAHPELGANLVGCIVLGSAANVTDENHHPWFKEFELLIDSFVRVHAIPFLGICFAHQFIADRDDAKVDFVPSNGPGVRRYVFEKRQLQVVSPRFKLLLSDVAQDEWNRASAKAQDFSVALKALADGRLRDEYVNRPLAPCERAASRIADSASPVYEGWSRHWQMVHRQSHAISQTEFVPSLRNTEFLFDGLIHRTNPWFTLQTHPERPLTATSQVLLRNFLLLCGMVRRQS
jgi:GMP synthase-like glutamine amidotransferase